MIISPDNQTVAIEFPKTGSTWIRLVLLELGWRVTPNIPRHYTPADANYMLRTEQGVDVDRVRWVVSVRDPLEWCYSMWRHNWDRKARQMRGSWNPGICSTMWPWPPIPDFLEWIRWLTAERKDTLDHIFYSYVPFGSHVLRTSNLEEDFLAFWGDNSIRSVTQNFGYVNTLAPKEVPRLPQGEELKFIHNCAEEFDFWSWQGGIRE